MTTKDYIATYKGIGIETNVDFEAQYAGQNFDDIRALAAQTGLEALMLGEEAMILGGNTSMALGVTATPTLAASTSGGSLRRRDLVGDLRRADPRRPDEFLGRDRHPGVDHAAPTPMSRRILSAAARRRNPPTPRLPSPARPAASPRRSRPRAAPSVTPGIWGAAGSEALGRHHHDQQRGHHRRRDRNADRRLSAGRRLVVQCAGLRRPAHPGASSRAPARNVTVQPTGAAGAGTPLTADGAGGIVEIEAVLKANWDLYRLSPDEVWVSSQEAAQYLEENPRRRRHRRAALHLRHEAGRHRRRRDGHDLQEQIFARRRQVARHQDPSRTCRPAPCCS